jgi:hypothetical protein
MNFGRRLSEKYAAGTSARKDETFTGSSQHDDWLRQVAARFRSAITLQIPVGYEDETGFHQVPPNGCEPQRTNEKAFQRF